MKKKFDGKISKKASYPWVMSLGEMQELFSGNTKRIDAKKELILAIEDKINGLKTTIDTIKSI